MSGSRSDSAVSSVSMVPGLLTCGASRISALVRIVAAVADVGDAPSFQVNAHLCAVAVS